MRFIIFFLFLFAQAFSINAYAEIALSPKTGVFPETYRNETYLRTGHRGCLSCHDNLKELAQRAGHMQHAMGNLGDAYGMELNFEYCKACHTIPGGGLAGKMSEAIHGIHKPDRGFDGDCFSCHAVKPDGTMVIWDLIKYDPSVTSGWSTIIEGGYVPDTMLYPREWLAFRGNYEGYMDGFVMDPEFKGKFIIDKTPKITDKKDRYVAQNYGTPDMFMPADKDYTLTVTGDYAKTTKVYTVKSLKAFKQDTRTYTTECAINIAGGSMIHNTESSGPRVTDILEDVGIKTGANAVIFHSYDNWKSAHGIQFLQDKKAQLILELGGEPTPAQWGGPVALRMTGGPAGKNAMWLKSIEITHRDPSQLHADAQPVKYVFEPVNSGILVPPRDATVVSSKGTTFEGFAYGWDDYITRIQFSADNGKTWKNIDIPKYADRDQWVTWKYEWQPPKPGVYLIKVRAFSDGIKMNQLKESNRIVVVR